MTETTTVPAEAAPAAAPVQRSVPAEILARMPRLFEPAPVFKGASVRNPRFAFDSLGGRAVALVFLGSATRGPGARVAADLAALSERLNDEFAICAVTFDPQDRAQAQQIERLRFVLFHDEAQELGRLYGVTQPAPAPEGQPSFIPATFIVDPRQRVFARLGIAKAEEHAAEIERVLTRVPRTNIGGRQAGWAPVLEVPRIFEPELCRRLIAYYEAQGGEPSGFMRQHGDKTVGVLDKNFKRRNDAQIVDEALRDACRNRIMLRLVPEILRAFQFRATRIERDIVARYDGQEGGFFRAHRDNTTTGTAHRRFAVTVNLNAEEFEGGELRFPEYGPASYRAATGGAVVFSCSLLHEALPVTRGLRYCYLPFLYDDQGAEIRQKNLHTLDPNRIVMDDAPIV